MFPLLFRHMLGASTARNRLKEVDLKLRRSKKATFLTARHKQERFRFAYNFNVLRRMNDRVPPPGNVKELRQAVDLK